MTDQHYLKSLRKPSAENPLRILMSACLAGMPCGYDGSTYGEYPSAQQLLKYSNAKIVRFCPEDYSFGTPRAMCDIHGGNGNDVLDGRAKVLTADGEDWTEGMIAAAHKMLALAQDNQIELAVLMDISAACGSQVIYNGNRFDKNTPYQIGAGVCASLLLRNGFKVISQRDFASLEILYSKLNPAHQVNKDALDQHQVEWYKNYFKV